MAIKKWKITAELFMNASRYDDVVVKANTEIKAVKFGCEELRKKHKTDMVSVTKVEQVE